MTDRFRLSRAGVLNVWQYDEQIFEFGGGRLLLRGTNGAGKSKTLEMLLPFVIDGDKARITASGRHHTSLLWLMLDGYSGQNRAGYLWVEFARTDGERRRRDRHLRRRDAGVSESARAATAWFFTYPGASAMDLLPRGRGGPAGQCSGCGPRSRPTGTSSTQRTRRYREHVGRLLFGLELDAVRRPAAAALLAAPAPGR